MNSLPELIRLTGLKLYRFVANGTDWIGHIGLQAQMTLWLIRFAQETDAPNGYDGRMCKRTPKPSTETGPCTFAIAQFGWVHKNKIFIDNHLPQVHTPCPLPKAVAHSAQKIRHPNIDEGM